MFGGTNVSERTIEEGGLTYISTIEGISFESDAFEETYYNIIGLFGDVYVPLKGNTPDKLARLLLDCCEEYRLVTGETLDLGSGYELTVKQIYVKDDEVWMELSKEGVLIDDEIIDISDGGTWILDMDIEGENDVVVFRTHVNNLLKDGNLVVIDGLWMIDYDDVFVIESGDSFGILEIDTIGSTWLAMYNNDTINLTRGSIQEIGGGLKFMVADSNNLEFTLIKERTEYPNLCPVREEEVPTSSPFMTAGVLGIALVLFQRRKQK
ncbi:S-layer protein domain-containing protein [Methanohalophilus halophilus]|uniref:S-layer protein domain-containing protein n=1 Tax=Methanohalophilus halophilus TaxID=2177 RepID=UPI00228598D9|nr:S-layer protein domain-containing protein [Methanohalophilus halophilus]